MKNKRILSMLLAASLALPSFAFTAAADTAAETEESAIILVDSAWLANENAVKPVTDGNPDGAPTDYIRVLCANGKDGYIYSSNNMGTLLKGNTYNLSFWVRLSPDTVNVGAESSAVTSLQLRLGGWYMASTIADNNNFTIVSCDENGSAATAGAPSLNAAWTKYTVVFTPKKNINVKNPGILICTQSPSRAFDVGGFTLTQVALNDAGKYVALEGSEKYDDSSWNTPSDYWACNFVGAFAAYSKFFPRSDSGYLVPMTNGTAPEITYSGVTVPAGKYEISGKFALNGLNLPEYTFVDGYSPSISVEHTAALTLKVISGSRVIASAMQEISHEADTYTYTVDIKDDITAAEISFSLGENEAFRYENITLTKIADLNYSDKWVDANGDKAEVFANVPDLDTSVASYYYRFSDAVGIADGNGEMYQTRHAFRYYRGSFTLKAGTEYEMTMWMRYDPDFELASGVTYTQGVSVMWDDPYPTNKSLSKKGDNGIVNVTYLDEGNGDENQDGDGMLTLSTEWKKFTVRFNVDGGTYLKNYGIYFLDGTYKAYTRPIDMAAFSIVELDENGNAVPGSELITDDKSCWQLSAGAGLSYNATKMEKINVFAEDEFYRIHAGAANTEAYIGGMKGMSTAEAGLYSVKVFLRTPNGEADVSAKFNGTLLETLGGKTSVTLDSSWKLVTFALDAELTAQWNKFCFVLDGATDLDIAGFEAELVQKYVYAEDFEKIDGSKLTIINNTGYLDPSVSDHYYRFWDGVGMDNGEGGKYQTRHAFRYYKSNFTLKTDTEYEMTLWMRFAPDAYVPEDANVSKGIYVMWDDPYSTNKSLSKKGDNGIINVTYLDEGNGDENQDGDGMFTLSTEWKKFTVRFNVDEYTYLRNYGIYFLDGSYMQYTRPIDIAAFSIVTLDENGNAIVGSELISDDASCWKLDGGYGLSYNATAMNRVNEFSKNEYYRADADDDGITATEIRPVSDEPLVKGIYHITGLFRTPEANAKLSAKLGESILTAINGAADVELTNEWTEYTFVLDLMADGMSMSDIVLSLDECTDFDIYGVSITLVERHVSISDVNPGNIIMLLLLNKEYKIPESEANNLLAAANRRAGLRKWSYGDQKLELMTDDDGDLYMQASNITSNKLGFTYKDGTVLKKGFYRFKGEFRTSVEGEDGMVRLSLCDSTAASLINNEWKEVSVIAELKEDVALSIKIFGGAVASSVQDYQFRNLELIDLANDPIPYEYYASDFEDASKLTGWSTGGQGAGTFTWNSEDGNGYMTVSDRLATHTPAYYGTGVTTIPGATYIISYDIRTTVPGEETVARANINWNNITVDEPVDSATPNLYKVTNEWRHIEHTYVPTIETALALMINTAPGDDKYNVSLDIDNVKIVRMIGIRPNYYAAGNFDDAGTALIGWGTGGQGAVTFTWNEEDGNGYVTASGRASNLAGPYRDFGVKTVTGKTYKISFDIRTSNPGEKTVVRTKIAGDIANMKPGEAAITITNDWTHVEISYTAKDERGLWMLIFGGPNSAYNHDIDFDNVTLDIID